MTLLVLLVGAPGACGGKATDGGPWGTGGGPKAACDLCAPNNYYECPSQTETKDIEIVDQIDGGCSATYGAGTDAEIRCEPLQICVNGSCSAVTEVAQDHICFGMGCCYRVSR